MIAKPKHKSGFWSGDGFFPQDFEIALDLPLQEAIKRLRSIEQHYFGLWNPFSPDVWLQTVDEDVYNFKVYYNPYRRERRRATVKCVGVIFVDNWSSQTLIKGRFTPNPNLSLFWLIMLIGIFLIKIEPNLWVWGILTGFASVGLILRALLDRRKLRALIYEALQSG